VAEILDVAGNRVHPEPAGPRLPAPVERRDPPATAPPVLHRLEVFLVSVAPAREEQQAAARLAGRFGPVDAADRVAVRRRPAAFAGFGRNGAAIECRRFRLANSALLAVVTF
jgi:hypothetical protein